MPCPFWFTTWIAILFFNVWFIFKDKYAQNLTDSLRMKKNQTGMIPDIRQITLKERTLLFGTCYAVCRGSVASIPETTNLVASSTYVHCTYVYIRISQKWPNLWWLHDLNETQWHRYSNTHNLPRNMQWGVKKLHDF